MPTLDQAKAHLRVDHTHEDALIQSMIDAATQSVANHLDMHVDDMEDYIDMPAPVAAAILLRVADLFENREAVNDRPYSKNPTFEALLNPYRSLSA